MTKISFEPLEDQHLTTLRRWFQEEHVREVWDEPRNEAALRAEFLEEMPKSSVRSFIIRVGERDAGYIQYYNASRSGGGWWPDEDPGVFGMDLFIGEPDMLNRGHGPRIIREFVAFMRACEPTMTSALVDPEPGNLRAIRAYEKAGFLHDRQSVTPDGPALLMRIRF